MKITFLLSLTVLSLGCKSDTTCYRSCNPRAALLRHIGPASRGVLTRARTPRPRRPKVSDWVHPRHRGVLWCRVLQRCVENRLLTCTAVCITAALRVLRRPESASKQRTIPTIFFPFRSLSSICCRVLGEANSRLIPISRQYQQKSALMDSDFVRLRSNISNITGRNHKFGGLRLIL